MKTTSYKLSKKSTTSSIQYLGTDLGYALPVCMRSITLRVTERSIIEKDDVVKCISESFVIGPDFTQR